MRLSLVILAASIVVPTLGLPHPSTPHGNGAPTNPNGSQGVGRTRLQSLAASVRRALTFQNTQQGGALTGDRSNTSPAPSTHTPGPSFGQLVENDNRAGPSTEPLPLSRIVDTLINSGHLRESDRRPRTTSYTYRTGRSDYTIVTLDGRILSVRRHPDGRLVVFQPGMVPPDFGLPFPGTEPETARDNASPSRPLRYISARERWNVLVNKLIDSGFLQESDTVLHLISSTAYDNGRIDYTLVTLDRRVLSVRWLPDGHLQVFPTGTAPPDFGLPQESTEPATPGLVDTPPLRPVFNMSVGDRQEMLVATLINTGHLRESDMVLEGLNSHPYPNGQLDSTLVTTDLRVLSVRWHPDGRLEVYPPLLLDPPVPPYEPPPPPHSSPPDWEP